MSSLLFTKLPTSPFAILNKLIGVLPSVISVDLSPIDCNNFNWFSCPETAISLNVPCPSEETMELNICIWICDISFDFCTSRTFFSEIYLISASLACWIRSSSASYKTKISGNDDFWLDRKKYITDTVIRWLSKKYKENVTAYLKSGNSVLSTSLDEDLFKGISNINQ